MSAHLYLAADADRSEGYDINAYRCRNLWRAVVLQAIKDIINCASTAEREGPEDISIYTPDARAYATRWIMEGGDRFRAVCSMAELEPEIVMRRVRILLDGEQV